MSQKERLLDYLGEHKTITSMQALNELGIYRLASRISNLKKEGYPVTSRMVPVKNRWGEVCHVSEYTMGDYDALK